MLVLQGRLKAGEWLLINGVSSGVGVASLQLGKALGAQGHRHLGLGRQAGGARSPSASTSACARARADFAPAVMEATGQHGVDLVVNTVGGSVFAENIRALAFEGRLATVGYVDGVLHADIDLEALHAKRLTLFGVSNKLRTQGAARGGRAALRRARCCRISPPAASSRRSTRSSTSRSWRTPRRAWKPARHVGKIVLRMPVAPDPRIERGDKPMKRHERWFWRSPWAPAPAAARGPARGLSRASRSGW